MDIRKQGDYFDRSICDYFDETMSIATSRKLLYNYKYYNIENEYELVKIHNA